MLIVGVLVVASLAAAWYMYPAAFMLELGAYRYFAKLLYDIVALPQCRERTPIVPFLTAFASTTISVLSYRKRTTCEEVVEKACGKGNFTHLHGRVAIVTGASSGLGMENARCLMKYGCHVIWAVRNPAKAEAALKKMEAEADGKIAGKATILTIDISDLTTVKPFVDSFLALNLPLHYLICNAGIMAPPQWEQSKQGHEKMFATNNLGHFLITELLLPKLKETGKESEVRVVILSSNAAEMATDINPAELPCPKEKYHEWSEYCVTKAVDAMHARHMQETLKHDNIVTVAVHPGIIATGLGAGNLGLTSLFYYSKSMAFLRYSIPVGAATTLYAALSPDVTQQVKRGTFFYYHCAPQTPLGVTAKGVRDDLVDACQQRMVELVEEYM